MKRLGQQGFSLIELLVVIVILAILASLGVPSYQQWVRNTRIRNAAESIQNGLRLARSEATQRSADVRFELTSATGADWTVCMLNTGATTCSGTGSVVPIQSFVSSGGANGVQLNVANAIGNMTVPLSGSSPNASGVTYNALGRPDATSGTPIARIDASTGQTGDRWLVTTISSGGMVHSCDPQLSLTVSPQGCQ